MKLDVVKRVGAVPTAPSRTVKLLTRSLVESLSSLDNCTFESLWWAPCADWLGIQSANEL